MAGPRVVILYEDRTSEGLHNLTRTIVTTLRAEAGGEPIRLLRGARHEGQLETPLGMRAIR